MAEPESMTHYTFDELSRKTDTGRRYAGTPKGEHLPVDIMVGCYQRMATALERIADLMDPRTRTELEEEAEVEAVMREYRARAEDHCDHLEQELIENGLSNRRVDTAMKVYRRYMATNPTHPMPELRDVPWAALGIGKAQKALCRELAARFNTTGDSPDGKGKAAEVHRPSPVLHHPPEHGEEGGVRAPGEHAGGGGDQPDGAGRPDREGLPGHAGGVPPADATAPDDQG